MLAVEPGRNSSTLVRADKSVIPHYAKNLVSARLLTKLRLATFRSEYALIPDLRNSHQTGVSAVCEWERVLQSVSDSLHYVASGQLNRSVCAV